jgi:FAD/FMN-containing dehydrogenase
MCERRIETMVTTIDGILEGLRSSLRGELITASDAGYEEHRRVWNGLVDKRPAAIARVRGAADVMNCVNFARDNRLPLSVRGGGHSVSGTGTCDDGLVIDFSFMRSVRVDLTSGTVRAEAGCRLADLDRETQAFGMATPAGVVSDTGIAGLALGGGMGWLQGKHGLTVDNLLSVDIVTASGKLLRADETENADLFWGIRGGSGNFGAVTSFEFRLHPVGPLVAGGLVAHPAAKGREVVRFYREFIASAPDELTVYCGFMTSPEGDPIVALACGYSGPMDQAEEVLRPLKEFGPPAMDMMGPMPYVALQSMLDEGFIPGRLNYWKADFVRELSDELIETIADHSSRTPSPLTGVMIIPVSGKASRVASDATAFPHRKARCQVGIYSAWEDPAATEANISWTRDFWHALRPFAAGSVYVNDLDTDDGEDRLSAAYGSSYKRLADLKAKYDPENLFRLNANIRPRRT